jgi:predicted lipoprotein with Yx(FWY)xxD motif
MISRVGPLRALSRRRMALAVPAVAAAAVAVAACGGYASGGRARLYQPPPSSAPAAGASAASGSALTLRHTALGTILTTGKGFTVYAFEADKGTTSACTGACAAAWPPVTASSSITAAGGASTSLVALTTRPGGVHQLTYAGHPLYTYAGDTTPGATSGQGSEAFGARWDVLTAAGQEVKGG